MWTILQLTMQTLSNTVLVKVLKRNTTDTMCMCVWHMRAGEYVRAHVCVCFHTYMHAY